METHEKHRCRESGKLKLTKKEAKTFINQHKDRYLRSYPCPECNSWHLTHKKTDNGGGAVWELKLNHEQEFKQLLK